MSQKCETALRRSRDRREWAEHTLASRAHARLGTVPRFDDSMQPADRGAIRRPHPRDLREHGAFPLHLVRASLQFLEALLHRGSLLGRESPGRLAGRGGALGGLLRGLLGVQHRYDVLLRTSGPRRGQACL